MKHFKAIAAMSENRVIGEGNKIPWHLPEDFKWFRQTTTGNVVVMGRKTFEGLGKPLPNRTNLVLTRHPRRLIKTYPNFNFQEWRGGKQVGNRVKKQSQLLLTKLDKYQKDNVLISKSLEKLNPLEFEKDIFICGGAQIYEQILPACSDLYLTLVKREVHGDAFFPPFEEFFKPYKTIMDCAEFQIIHYRHRSFF